MALVPDNLAHCNYPIETPTQIKFWASSHKCNQAKAVIAFSYDEENAHRNMRRLLGWSYFFRKRALDSFGHFINTPSMSGIPFSEMENPYWECMPYGGGGTPPVESKPTVTIVTSPTPVQVGDSVVITARVKGNPVPTISWKVSVNGKETTLPDTDDSVSYTVAEAGTLTFTCTATNKLGSDSDSITYTASEKPVVHDIELIRPADGDKFRSENVYKGSFKVNKSGFTAGHALPKYRTPDGSVYEASMPDTSVTPEGNNVYSYYFSDGYWALQNADVQFYVEVLSGSTRDRLTSNEVTIQWSSSAPKPLIPPYITKQPTDTTVNEGSSVTLEADASNYNSVKWQVSTNGTNWNDIPGSMSKNYTFTTSISDNGNKYRAVFTNTNGDSETNSATLTVDAVTPSYTFRIKPAEIANNYYGYSKDLSIGEIDPPSNQWEPSGDVGVIMARLLTNGSYVSLMKNNDVVKWNDYDIIHIKAESEESGDIVEFNMPWKTDSYQGELVKDWYDLVIANIGKWIDLTITQGLGSINFDPTKPEDVVIDKLGPVKLTAVANPTGLDGEPTYSWTCSPDGINWGGCVGSGSNSLEYYLSIAETPAKGETKYFKCIGNGTSGGVAIPQEETRVVSVTHTNTPDVWDDTDNWNGSYPW